ncbi:glycosyltransferase family 2 protein [Paracoccus ravus]|uniref:glycosyltransferase family 2 protein n=1 Tax=Paracoccus ravus TaxID=2447760 RepID=UPI001FD6E248|nr:glycosyltransferase family 2 protein [Paracoccus ravus]
MDVIIPYFQESPGILARALRSVGTQTGIADLQIEVYVVDDHSPRPAALELTGIVLPDHVRLHLIEQRNGGPGAARNSGLDAADRAGKAEFVAFLDSDDEWEPHHLSDAIDALRYGYDFYFCDTSRPGFFEAYTDQIPLFREGGQKLSRLSELLNEHGPVRGFEPHALSDIFFEYCPCHTSSVVMRRNAIGSLRFDTSLRNAGEDWMFWLRVEKAGARVAISWKRNSRSGEGVNIFFKSLDWDTPGTIKRIGCKYLFSLKLKMIASTSQKDAAAAMQTKYRRAFSYLFARNVMKFRAIPVGLSREIIRRDPAILLMMPFLFAKVFLTKCTSEKEW